jgi:hypothetical protein
MMWHACIVVWRGGRHVSSEGQVSHEAVGGGSDEGGWEGGSVNGGGGMSWQS